MADLINQQIEDNVNPNNLRIETDITLNTPVQDGAVSVPDILEQSPQIQVPEVTELVEDGVSTSATPSTILPNDSAPNLPTDFNQTLQSLQLYNGLSRNQLLRNRRFIMPQTQMNEVESLLTPMVDGEGIDIPDRRSRFRRFLDGTVGAFWDYWWGEVDPNDPQIGLFGNNFGDFNIELPGIGARRGFSRLLYGLGLLPNVGQGIGADIGRRAAARVDALGLTDLLSTGGDILKGIFVPGELGSGLDALTRIPDALQSVQTDDVLRAPIAQFFPELFSEETRVREQEFFRLTEDGEYMPYLARALSGQDLAFANFQIDAEGRFNPFGILGDIEDFGEDGRMSELPRLLLGMAADVALDPFTGIFNDNIDDIARFFRRTQSNRVSVVPPISQRALLPASTTGQLPQLTGVDQVLNPRPIFNRPNFRRTLPQSIPQLRDFVPIQIRRVPNNLTVRTIDDIPIVIPNQLDDIIDAEIVNEFTRAIRPQLQHTDLVHRLPSSIDDINISPRLADSISQVANSYNNIFPIGVSHLSIQQIISAIPNQNLQDYLRLNTRQIGNNIPTLPSARIQNVNVNQLVNSVTNRPISTYTQQRARSLRQIINNSDLSYEELFTEARRIGQRTDIQQPQIIPTNVTDVTIDVQPERTLEELFAEADAIEERALIREQFQDPITGAPRTPTETPVIDQQALPEARLEDPGSLFPELSVKKSEALMDIIDRNDLDIGDGIAFVHAGERVQAMITAKNDSLSLDFTVDGVSFRDMRDRAAIPFDELKQFARRWRELRSEFDQFPGIISTVPGGLSLDEAFSKMRAYTRYGFHPIRLSDMPDDLSGLNYIFDHHKVADDILERATEGIDDNLRITNPDAYNEILNGNAQSILFEDYTLVYIDDLNLPVRDIPGNEVGTVNRVHEAVADIVEPSVLANPDAYDEIQHTLPDAIRAYEPDERTLAAIDNYNFSFSKLEDSFNLVTELETQLDELNNVDISDYNNFSSYLDNQEETLEELVDQWNGLKELVAEGLVTLDADTEAIYTIIEDLANNPSTRNASRYIEQIRYRLQNQLQDAFNDAIESYDVFENTRGQLEELTTNSNREFIQESLVRDREYTDSLIDNLGQGNRNNCF